MNNDFDEYPTGRRGSGRGRASGFPRGGSRGHRGPFGPGGPEEGPGFGPGPHGGPHGGPHRGRARRGQVRTAILILLTDQPMHGYQLMQEISERTSGRWNPSPGVVYPAISQLEEDGLVTVGDDGGRKLVTLTEEGSRYVAANRGNWRDPFAEFESDSPDLRALSQQLRGAVREVAVNGTDEQRAAAAEILTQARRSIYLLLAQSPD